MVASRTALLVAVTSLFIVALVLPGAASGVAQTRGKILTYATAVPPGEYEYHKDRFDEDLPSILSDHGYTVTVTDRVTDPQITSTLLEGYDQLWIFSSDEDSAGHFSQDEINTILDFRLQGHGLLIMADHTYPPQPQYYASDANQIANLLGVNFYGMVDHGDIVPIAPDFDSHPLSYQVNTIRGHSSEALMTVTSPVDVVATYQVDTIIAVLDNGQGRVVFDVAFPRFFDNTTHIGDTQQYIRNIADWLQHILIPTVPGISDWGLVVLTLLLLTAGVALIILKRQPTTR